MSNLKRTVLAAAIVTAIGISPANAGSIVVSYDGWLTLLNPLGTDAVNNFDASGGWSGWRTPITGTMNFDTTTGTGSGTMVPFSFFGSGLWATENMSLQSIGNGGGGPGDLILGNMNFNWAGSYGIPVSIVWDASGLYSAISGGLTTSDVITGVGALPATNDFIFPSKVTYTLPLGPAPIATTTFNTMNIGTPTLGTNPSGTLPLTDDGIGGSPMPAGPFPNFNASFDFMELHVDSITAVPIPPALWLFGSGLLGLIGIARRKKAG